MRIHGYEDTGQPIEAVVPALLAEMTLNATPDELLAIAEFLRQCAREMNRMGDAFDHLHLADRKKEFETSLHFAVVRGQEPGR